MKPHITANTFASFLTAKTPQRKLSIVRAARRAQLVDKGYAPFYQSLWTPAKAFLIQGGRDARGLMRLIVRMNARRGGKWHMTDAEVTAGAAQALLNLTPEIQRLNATFVPVPAGTKAKIEYPELDLLVTPHLFVEKRQNRLRRVGAMRFYTAKESTYELGRRGAELVAGMQHQWLVSISSGEAMPDHSLCMVVECFQGRITLASADTEQTRQVLEQGYRDFMRLWHGLDHEYAA